MEQKTQRTQQAAKEDQEGDNANKEENKKQASGTEQKISKDSETKEPQKAN